MPLSWLKILNENIIVLLIFPVFCYVKKKLFATVFVEKTKRKIFITKNKVKILLFYHYVTVTRLSVFRSKLN